MTATSNHCMISESFKRLEARDNADEFELALKSSSATAFIGMIRFIFMSDITQTRSRLAGVETVGPAFYINMFPTN